MKNIVSTVNLIVIASFFVAFCCRGYSSEHTFDILPPLITLSKTPIIEAKSPSPETKTDQLLNVGIFGIFIPGLDVPAQPGVELGYIYETRQYAVDVELHFTTDESYSAAFASISGRYFHPQQSISPYVGVGGAIGTFLITTGDPTDASGFGIILPTLDIYACAGIEMFRQTNSRLKLKACTNMLLPFWQIRPISIGLSFAYDIGNWF